VTSIAGSCRFCRNAEEAPTLPGAYVLQIELPHAKRVRIASQSPIILAAGRYLYCGSANGPGGLKARLTHHFRCSKPVRWHVDQLTSSGQLLGSWVVPDGDECELVRMLRHLPVPIPGFGSSDCTTCKSHLLSWPNGLVLPVQMLAT
jgi:Uri superfamily endonuclease